jgi:hypothetical protein
VAAYKPSQKNFVAPACALGLACVWLNRRQGKDGGRDRPVGGATDFEVADLKTLTGLAKNRQGMAPLDDAAHRREGSEDLVALRFDQTSCSLPLYQ